MPKLEGVQRAMAEKARKAREDGKGNEILDEVKLVGMAVKLEPLVKEFAEATRAINKRLSDIERDVRHVGNVLNRSVTSIEIPDHTPSIQSLDATLSNLRAELEDAFKIVAQELKKAQSIDIPQPKDVDLSPIHQELVGLYDAMGNLNIPMPDQKVVEYVQPEKREWEFTIKRSQGGFIRTIDVKEK